MIIIYNVNKILIIELLYLIDEEIQCPEVY